MITYLLLPIGYNLSIKNNMRFFSMKQQSVDGRYAITVGLVGLLYFVLTKINHRDGLADFRVYYDAANAIANNTQLYGVAFGVSSGFYKYSPFTAVLFLPFTLLPFNISAALFLGLIVFALGRFAPWLHKLIEQLNGFKMHHKGWLLFASTIFVGHHLEREWHLGNVNLFLLILVSFIFYLLHDKQTWLAGLLYGFVLLVKLHFVILLPYIIWKKQWRVITFMLLGVTLGLVFPALWKGWNGNLSWLNEWVKTIDNHNTAVESNLNTIFGLYTIYLYPITQLPMSTTIATVLVLIVGGVFGTLLLIRLKSHQGSIQFIEYFTLVALIPNLAHTDTEHFMWSWPLIAYCLAYVFIGNARYKTMLIALLIVSFIPYCLNSRDIIGIEMGMVFDRYGLLGLSNLLIILTANTIFQIVSSDKLTTQST